MRDARLPALTAPRLDSVTVQEEGGVSRSDYVRLALAMAMKRKRKRPKKG
ncbi:MAG: hypothetical protein RLP09_41700 [Sandaracinaceae bacterium]